MVAIAPILSATQAWDQVGSERCAQSLLGAQHSARKHMHLRGARGQAAEHPAGATRRFVSEE